MNTQPHDMQAIFARIDALEKWHRELLRIVVGGLLAVAIVVLTGALSARGQQGKATAKTKTPGFVPVPQEWRMPDGRVVEFPSSISKDEIDSVAKRIGDGAIELPAGAKVIGWEPVEGAISVPPEFEQRVATIPAVKGKLDSLANAAGILQSEIEVEQSRVDDRYNELQRLIGIYDKNFETVQAQLDQLGALAADNDFRIRAAQNGLTGANPRLDDLRRDFDEFKEAACPVLRTARVGESTRTELDSACGLR